MESASIADRSGSADDDSASADSSPGRAGAFLFDRPIFPHLQARGPDPALRGRSMSGAPTRFLPLPLWERAGVRGKLRVRSSASPTATSTPHPNPLPQGERE